MIKLFTTVIAVFKSVILSLYLRLRPGQYLTKGRLANLAVSKKCHSGAGKLDLDSHLGSGGSKMQRDVPEFFCTTEY